MKSSENWLADPCAAGSRSETRSGWRLKSSFLFLSLLRWRKPHSRSAPAASPKRLLESSFCPLRIEVQSEQAFSGHIRQKHAVGCRIDHSQGFTECGLSKRQDAQSDSDSVGLNN